MKNVILKICLGLIITFLQCNSEPDSDSKNRTINKNNTSLSSVNDANEEEKIPEYETSKIQEIQKLGNEMKPLMRDMTKVLLKSDKLNEWLSLHQRLKTSGDDVRVWQDLQIFINNNKIFISSLIDKPEKIDMLISKLDRFIKIMESVE